MSERDLDRELSYDRDVFADDVQPFFGEKPAPVGQPLPPMVPEPRRGTIDELRRWRIAQGHCARASCSGMLDAEGCCGFCGWSLTEERARRRLEKGEAA